MLYPKFVPALLAVGMLLGAPTMAQKAPKKVKIKRKTEKTLTPITLPGNMEAPGAAALPSAQPTDYAARYAGTITQDDLRQHLSILASDEYEGRETGEKGQKMAADYIARQFEELGLRGPVEESDNHYLQHFTMNRSTWKGDATLKVGRQTYKWMQDFYGSGSSPFQQPTAVQPVFVGYGIEQDGYSDYAGLDVKGKDLIVLMGEPTDAAGKRLLSKSGEATKWGNGYRAKAALAVQKGARSVFFVYDPSDNYSRIQSRLAPSLSKPSISFADEQNARAATFFVAPAVGYKLLGTTEAGLRAYTVAAGKTGKPPVAGKLKPAKFTINAPKETTQFTTENVLGYLEGGDLKEELIVVSAHYDHIGIINGEVYNGADDDGSGTVSVLEIAQAFVQAKKDGHGPRRSILFLTVTGEEKGLLGSEYYTDHPVFPLDQTVADLNIDMVGRTDKEHEGRGEYVYVIGSDKLSSELYQIVEEAKEKGEVKGLELDYRFNDPADPNRFYYRSDHYNFAKHRIPVAFFFNGVHDDYHGPKDEVDKIEFDKMEKRDRLVFYAAWELANRDKRIVVDSNKP